MDMVFNSPNTLRAQITETGRNMPLPARNNGVDILLFPSAISSASTLEEALGSKAGVDSYVQDVLTVPASLAGLPAASCPVQALPNCGQLPVGVQVVGQWGDDELVLDVAEILETQYNP